jgi:2Fe-2S ferredoxin
LPLLTFLRGGRSYETESDGTTVLEAARRAGLPLASSCRGAGICDACRVVVLEGFESLSDPTARELEAKLAPGERLACQAHILGPATVTTSYW